MAAFKEPTGLHGRQIINNNLKKICQIKFKIRGIWGNGRVGYRVWDV